MSTTTNAVTDTGTAQCKQEKLYWRDYKGCVLNEGDHFESDTGALLYWHSYEANEAQTRLTIAALEARNTADKTPIVHNETRQASTFSTRTIQHTNRSGTFSTHAEYTPLKDGRVQIEDWTFDAYGILPSGTDIRIVPLIEAQTEYRERKAQGWQ